MGKGPGGIIAPRGEPPKGSTQAKERPDGLLPNLGGQTGLNLASGLSKAGILEKYGVETKIVDVNEKTASEGYQIGPLLCGKCNSELELILDSEVFVQCLVEIQKLQRR